MQETGPHKLVKLAARSLLSHEILTLEERLDLCRRLLANDKEALALARWGDEFIEIAPEVRYYIISALYMLLMPQRRRQRLAAYFTPPHLCRHILDRLFQNGLILNGTRILDPASGGAAFLVPVALLLRDQLRNNGESAEIILSEARQLLYGIEIEPGLARLSEMLLADIFSQELACLKQSALNVVRRSNALKEEGDEVFEAVISNPPYGRVFRASSELLDRWSGVISDKHVNTYALFTCLALEKVKRGGLVALVIPTSFISGPYFCALRTHMLKIASVLELNIIEKRSDAFLDVTQDTCVLILRRRSSEMEGSKALATASYLIRANGECRKIGFVDIPTSGDRAWALPSARDQDADEDLFAPFLSNLDDYGYIIKTGYFVWNRSRDRLSDRRTPLTDEFPLIWAQNIRSDHPITPHARLKREDNDIGLISFVKMESNSSALQKAPAVVVQRTTNRAQKRRLVAGLVGEEVLKRYGGFVTENHTIVISANPAKPQALPIHLLADVLNSKVVDLRYRRMSGTVNVSTRVLRDFRLPPAESILQYLARGLLIEDAVDAAYKMASSR